MGRLAGFKYKKVVRKLKKLGLLFEREGKGSHEIWYNPKTDCFTVVPRHSKSLPEGTLRAVLKEAKIEVDEFLKA